MEQGSSVYGKNVRIYGEVAPGSVKQESDSFILKFTIVAVEGEESLPVIYQWVVPDAFRVGNDVVVEGQINPDGVFQAHTPMPKCPSRYIPEK